MIDLENGKIKRKGLSTLLHAASVQHYRMFRVVNRFVNDVIGISERSTVSKSLSVQHCRNLWAFERFVNDVFSSSESSTWSKYTSLTTYSAAPSIQYFRMIGAVEWSVNEWLSSRGVQNCGKHRAVVTLNASKSLSKNSTVSEHPSVQIFVRSERSRFRQLGDFKEVESNRCWRFERKEIVQFFNEI